jgi:hypothetical protein
MKFFEVTAKCGHVGRGQFYTGLFYVRAEDGSAVAAIVRMMPRVKHDHKNAILAVIKVDYTAFRTGQLLHRANPYFNCHSVQEQRLRLAEIADGIQEETHSEYERRRQDDRLAKLEVLRRQYRKMNKYGDNDYDIGA